MTCFSTGCDDATNYEYESHSFNDKKPFLQVHATLLGRDFQLLVGL